MVSNAKRIRYVSENDFSSSEEETYEIGKTTNTQRGLRNKGRWLSKNAIMARENRLKKKLYVANLEKEVVDLKTTNSNYSKVIENQSMLITDLKKEIKYLKSVIANSKEIGKLIRNIHHNSGMSVTTSLDETLSLNDYVSKPKQNIARKTAHPWQEKQYPNYPTPESEQLELPIIDDLLTGVEFGEILRDPFISQTDLPDDDRINDTHLKEHNYTSGIFEDDENDDDVGVCLHVSKQRVSVEFCSNCSENASQSWND